MSLQHIIRLLSHCLIPTSAPPRVLCPHTEEDDSIRMVVIDGMDSVEGEVESRPEIHEFSAKQEVRLEATLGLKHIWAVELRLRLGPFWVFFFF